MNRQEVRIPVIRNISKKRKTGRLESAGFLFREQEMGADRDCVRFHPVQLGSKSGKMLNREDEKHFSKNKKWCMITSV